MKSKGFLGILVALKKLLSVDAAHNAFVAPLDDFSIHGGQTMEINWIDPIGATVNSALSTGDPENMKRVTIVAENLANTGYASWKVPPETPPGKYSMEIVADDGSTNYSPFFSITDPVSPITWSVARVVGSPNAQIAGSHKINDIAPNSPVDSSVQAETAHSTQHPASGYATSHGTTPAKAPGHASSNAAIPKLKKKKGVNKGVA